MSGFEDWLEDPFVEQRRRVRNMIAASATLHLMVAGSFLYLPEHTSRPLMQPAAIQVELLASLPAPPAPPAAKIPAAAPAAPVQPKVKILPKEAPRATRKPPPAPESIKRRPRPKELKYEDALAQLRQDLGDRAAPVLAAPSPKADVEAQVQAAPQALAGDAKGIELPPELVAWQLAVKRHIRSVWVTPPQFRERGLQTWVRVNVAADGRVLGAPEVTASSGDPYFDDNAIRAIRKASPLPPPPSAGARTIIFSPQEDTG